MGRILGRGLTNADIAAALHLSVPTVTAHVGQIFTELGGDNRVQVARAMGDDAEQA